MLSTLALISCLGGECGESDLPRVRVYPAGLMEGEKGPGSWKEVTSKDRISRMRVKVRAGRRNNVSKSIQGSRNMCSQNLAREHIRSARRLGEERKMLSKRERDIDSSWQQKNSDVYSVTKYLLSVTVSGPLPVLIEGHRLPGRNDCSTVAGEE